MSEYLVLVDFDNCRNKRLEQAISKGTQCIADYKDVFDDIVRGIVLQAFNTRDERREFSFRIYGGWNDSVTGDYTALHNILIECISDYRRTIRRSRLNFEIAFAPIFNPRARFDATLRSEPWRRPEGKISKIGVCHGEDGGRCDNLKKLECWINKGKCPVPACSAKLLDVAQRSGQKIVDTLIVADAIVASMSGKYDHIVVLSGDDDMIPAVLSGRIGLGKSSLARLNFRSERGRYDVLLHENGVNVYDI